MPKRLSGPYVSGRLTNKQQGSAIGGATITVNKTVYTDDEMQNATTTIVTNGTGDFSFYALPGLYTFTTTAVDAAPIEPIEILGNEGLGADRSGSGASVSPAQTITYNTDGTVHTVTVGGVTLTYTYNTDGTIATESDGTITRTFTYNNGSLTAVA